MAYLITHMEQYPDDQSDIQPIYMRFMWVYVAVAGPMGKITDVPHTRIVCSFHGDGSLLRPSGISKIIAV